MTDYRVAYVFSDDQPVAVFLDSEQDANPGNLLTYARLGEHSEASIDWVRQQPAATEDQYHDLHDYLTKHRYGSLAGYDTLDLVIDDAGLPR